MSGLVLVCGNVFDGISDALTGPAEILSVFRESCSRNGAYNCNTGTGTKDVSRCTPN